MRADGQRRRRERRLARGVEGDVGGGCRRSPSVNVTVPLAALPVFGPVADVTVAVNVTAWPNTDGLTEDVSTVSVAALLTAWSTESVLVANPVAPL